MQQIVFALYYFYYSELSTKTEEEKKSRQQCVDALRLYLVRYAADDRQSVQASELISQSALSQPFHPFGGSKVKLKNKNSYIVVSYLCSCLCVFLHETE